MAANDFYPIGTAGHPWGNSERAAWRTRQERRRSYDRDIVRRIDLLGSRFDRIDYGTLSYGADTYTLHALRSRITDPSLPAALITGGVHGYEISGMLGAFAFLDHRAADYAGRANLLVAPCVSPWAYERVSRWNYDAEDPNRNFREDGPARESTALMDLVRSAAKDYLVHIDLHETTDSDATEFQPALCARDGKSLEVWPVPDGFYLVADAANPQLAFQDTVIASVEKITRIARPDAAGEIIGSPVISRGVIAYPMAERGLCASITNARYSTTTEIYPDAPDATAALCVEAQVAAICAALDFALAPDGNRAAMDVRP